MNKNFLTKRSLLITLLLTGILVFAGGCAYPKLTRESLPKIPRKTSIEIIPESTAPSIAESAQETIPGTVQEPVSEPVPVQEPSKEPAPTPQPQPEPVPVQEPSKEPAPTPQPEPVVAQQTPDDPAWSVLAIVNEKRAEAGLAALTMNETLMDAANLRASELPQSFSHTRPDGSSCFTAVNVGYSCVGENIAAGYSSAQQVMDSWMDSEGHRANILNPSFTQIAIACCHADDSYGYYWVQIFIG